MTKNKLYIVVVFSISTLCISGEIALAVSTTWYNTLGDRKWQEPLNWDYGVPGSLDRAYISMDSADGPVISTAVSANAQRVYLGRTAAGSLDVSGGSLAVSDILYVGYNGFTGTLNITSGTINVNNRLEIGYTSSQGFLKVTGGLVKAKYVDLPYSGGLASHLQLDGGIFICENTFTVNSGGTGDITEGELQLNGNISSLSGFSGWGVPGALIFSYNSSTNKTTVTADPNFSPIATQPEPANNTVGLSPYIILKWRPGFLAAHHDVYFGNSFEDVNNADINTPDIYRGRFSSRDYVLEVLDLGRTYYWRIDEVNDANIWRGNIWNFKTDNGLARQPFPPDGSVGIDRFTDKVRWNPGPFAVAQDFYFGTSFEDVNDRLVPNIADLLSDADNIIIPESFRPLKIGQKYFWRVDSNNGVLPASKGAVWSFTVAPYNDITFFVCSDSHYDLNGARLTAQTNIGNMNRIPGVNFPAAVGGGLVNIPRGVLHCGDTTDDGKIENWTKWVEDFGLTGKEGLLNYPVYEAFGNHDGGPGTPVRLGIIGRNPLRPRVVNISSNGLHYSFEWDDIHIICLGICPGTYYNPYNPEYSIDFLISDLSTYVGNTNIPVIIFHHFGLDSYASTWWTEQQRIDYYNVIKNYNVIGIFHGHTHDSTIYQWNGIDIFNVPHMRWSPSSWGFMVAHVTKNTMTVVERKYDGTWGISLTKSIWIPSFCDYDDLQNFSAQWLREGAGLAADFDGNNKVDAKDFSIFASYWFQYCPRDWPW